MSKGCRECVYAALTGANIFCSINYKYVGEISCEDFEPISKPKTNADRIRSMTDEELAKYINELSNGDCPTAAITSSADAVSPTLERTTRYIPPRKKRRETPPKHGTGGMTMAEYIEREAAIDCLNFVCVPQCRKYAQEEIKKIPAADVAPVRHGRWYRFTKVSFAPQSGLGFGRYMWKCDVCNVGEEETKMPYCPNCGAKMDGGNDAED